MAATDRLHDIITDWDLLLGASLHGLDDRARCQALVLHRYLRPVWNFLYKALGDRHAADDLTQEFALRFLRGDFASLHPARGRFRDFVKVVLRHLVIDWRRRRSKMASLNTLEFWADSRATASEELDRYFVESWRRETIRQAWKAFRSACAGRKADYYTIFCESLRRPKQTSQQIAAKWNAERGTSIPADLVRQMIHRARKLFADCLRREIANSLLDTTPEMVEDELQALGLSRYVGKPRKIRPK